MKQPLHILYREENDKDDGFIRSYLAAAGTACEATRVETRRDFEAALGRGRI
jgi:hypothetical protein